MSEMKEKEAQAIKVLRTFESETVMNGGWRIEEEGIEMVYCHNMIGGWVENEWFCANGKRKEGAD